MLVGQSARVVSGTRTPFETRRCHDLMVVLIGLGWTCEPRDELEETDVDYGIKSSHFMTAKLGFPTL